MAGFPGKNNRPPVDPFTGAGDAPATPGYVVEPPQPVTTVSPPPPAPGLSSRVRRAPVPAIERNGPAPIPTTRPQVLTPPSGAPTPAVKSDHAPISANDIPPVTLPPFVVETVFEEDKSTPGGSLPRSAQASNPPFSPPESDVPTYSDPPPYTAVSPTSTPTPEPAQGPALMPTASSHGTSENFAFVADRIRLLYEQVNEELADSPTVGDYAMNTLKLAREALLKQDYASAEYYVQAVEAKLKRSATSMKMSRSPKMWLLYGWLFIMLLTSALFIAVTYTVTEKIFGVTVAPEFLNLLRAVGWGGIGGVIGALYNLPWFIQFREYDPAYNMNYVVRPLQGLLIGGVLFLLSQAGVLAGSVVIPGILGGGASDISIGPVFLYLLAALAGFKQEYVYEFLDNLLRAVFKVPQIPTELKTPVPPAGISTYNGTRR